MKFTIGHLFCGIGGSALGTGAAAARMGETEAVFETVGGIDSDPLACADFERLTGAPALCADMHELTCDELRAAWGPVAPDAVMSSPPCKGFSGLLSAKRAAEEHYQRMNRLMVRALMLLTSTWDRPPSLIFFENVPRIESRGKDIIAQCRAVLEEAGYAVATGSHNCGELGNLAQNRQRWFLLARHRSRVDQFVYQPPSMRVRACGEVLGPIAMPGDVAAAGAMHSVPNLSWKNWCRLALIPAGGDWRDLEGVLAEGQARRELFRRLPVTEWDEPAETVVGPGGSSSTNISDPRVAPLGIADRRNDDLGVLGWDDAAAAVTGQARPRNGRFSVADPRPLATLQQWFPNVLGVNYWDKPVQVVTGSGKVTSGRNAVADPRVPGLVDNPNRHWNKYKVNAWEAPASTVTGTDTRIGSGAPSVADPRPFGHVDRVTPWDQPVGTITRSPAPSSGAAAVADPRRFGNVDRVTPWEGPIGCVTSKAAPASGGPAVADPRWGGGRLGVTPWQDPAATVTGESYPSNGENAVADPRFAEGKRKNWQQVAGVTAWSDPAPTITSGAGIHAGAFQVADPRVAETDVALHCKPRPDAYRVLSLDVAARTITGSLHVDNGAAAIADTRFPAPDPVIGEPWLKPNRSPKFTPIIIAADGTWHRPLTTLELAALQGFPIAIDGEPLVLAGTSHTRWREAIGNAVPPPAAAAIGSQLLRALLLSKLGRFTLANEDIWVAPFEQDGEDVPC